MGDSVKAHNLSGIKEYGESITSFSATLTAAAAQTQRTFTQKVEGQRGEVINAFFKKLNILQEQVFQQGPAALKAYGEGVSDFSHTVQGLGFGKYAYTDKGEINNIVTTLSGPQYDEMIAKKNGLKSLMEEAQEALGSGTVDFTGYEEKAQGFIDEEIKARNTTHQGISDADDALKTVAETGKTSFADLAGVIKNAQAVLSAAPERVYQNIMKNHAVTVEKIGYLDFIQNEADAQVMIAAWEDRLETTVKMDPKSISPSGYLIISIEISSAVEDGKKYKIERYIDAFGKVEVETSKAHIKNLKEVNKGYAKELIATQAGLQEAKYDENSPEMIAMKRRVKAINKFNGLLQSVEELKIGTSTYSNYSNSTMYTHHTEYSFEILDLGRENDVIQFEVTENKDGVLEKKLYSSSLSVTSDDADLSNALKSLGDSVDKKEKEGMHDFLNILSATADFIPGGKPTKVAVGAFKAILNSVDASIDWDGGASTLGEAVPEKFIIGGKKIPFKEFTTGASRYLASRKKHEDNLSEQSKEVQKARLKLTNSLTGKGAISLIQENVPEYDIWKGNVPTNTPKVLSIDPNNYYDYDAYVREEYLDQYGVKKYLESNSTTLNMEEYMLKLRNTASPEIKEYLKGQSSLTIETMNEKQLIELVNALDKLPEGREGFVDNYLANNKYREALQ
ncbi:hypothetical protein [Streptococcus oralis]|jgi:hypothetical protein|uniref:hypothetical protein n=1 Tax=Streptococcus oralis TaxID=1303 RepID=UPI0022847C38|nr:hypothetical protein [Streptococcus oralis]MCY7108975.1 hypothetical protein [Streptococcus oralis]